MTPPVLLGISNNGQQAIKVDLPVLIESRLLVQASSGGGKSWVLRRLLEQSHGQVQQIIIDPEGEFGSLREKFDYVLAGKGGDTPAEPRTAKLLAKRLYELGVSAIVDISELHRHEQIRFVRLFLEALVAAPKADRHQAMVVIDECHLFAPEKGSAESTDAVIDLCTLGRKRGLCAILATQRLSKLNKDAAAELANKLIGRTGLDIDQQRAGDELGWGKLERLRLRDLKPGQFMAYGPALAAGVTAVTIGDVISHHPKVGERGLSAPPPPTDKIRKVLAKLADLPAEAEQEARTVDELKKALADTRRKLTLAENAKPAPPCDHEAEIRTLTTEAVNAAHAANQGLSNTVLLQKAIKESRDILDKAIGADGVFLPAPIPERTRAIENLLVDSPEKLERAAAGQMRSMNGYAPLSKSQQAILNALAGLEAIGVKQPAKPVVAVLSGASPTSGGYFNNLSKLNSQLGLIEYPSSGLVALTDEGRSRASSDGAPATLEELHERWAGMVSAPQVAILRALITIYPESIGKAELAEQIGVSPTSGGFFNNLSRLRTLGAVDYPAKATVAATALLFPEGLT